MTLIVEPEVRIADPSPPAQVGLSSLDSAKIAALFRPAATALPPVPQRAHFEVLDAFRGVAALCVMLHHFGNAAHIRLAQTGFIAVDFFMVLSGFVIAFAYDRRLTQGLRYRDYLRSRIIRLYPMVFIAGALALVFYAFAGTGISQTSWSTGAVMTICGLLLLPYFGVIGPSFAEVDAFPLNNPSWSLSEEVAVNVVYGAIGPRLSVKVTAALVALFGAGFLTIAVARHTLSFGWHQGDWLLGLVRCSYSFLYGALIAKVLATQTLKPKISNLLAMSIGGVLMVALCLPYLHVYSGILVTFMLTLGFPLIVVLGTQVQCKGRAAKLASLAGRLSYPMYLLHYPIMATAGAMAYAHGISGRPAALLGLFCAADVMILSWFVLKLDEPLRKIIGSRRGWVRTPAASAP